MAFFHEQPETDWELGKCKSSSKLQYFSLSLPSSQFSLKATTRGNKKLLNLHCTSLKNSTEYIVGVQAPLLLMKATSVAVRCGCAFTHVPLWRQHLWLYVVGVHSCIFCCEGNICGHTSWVGIHQYSVVRAISVALRCQCAFIHTFMKRNSVFLARCSQT